VAVSKINGFRAPYRSQTFQLQAEALAHRSGVVSMDGTVTQVGPTITVPPFMYIQQGLIIKKDVATVVTAPTLDAPYYLTVYTPTASNLDDLVFLFAKSPDDIGTGVIVASYDGGEWRLPQLLSLNEIYKDIDAANVDFGRIGPFSGVITTVAGPNYSNSSGVVVDRQGLRQRLEAAAVFPSVATDPDYSRVDRIIYRRPDDDLNRVGIRKFLVGGTFATTPTNLYTTQAFSSAAVHSTVKTVIDSANIAHVFTATGYGSSFQLSYSKISSNRQTIMIAATNLFAMSDQYFDAKIDENDEIHVVYNTSNTIRWRKVSTSGALVTGPNLVSAQATPCSKPSISITKETNLVFVAYQSLLGPSNNQIFFATIDFGGAVNLASINVTNNANNLSNANLFVTEDFNVYIAWEDSILTRCYYRKFNDIGVALDPVVEVSGATNRIGFGTLAHGAKNPKLLVSDNKHVFVTFLQDKGLSVYGLSVWTDGAAFMQQLVSGAENFTSYAVYLDPIFNSVNLLLARSSNINYVKLLGQTVKINLAVAANGASGLATTRDNLGSMFHLWSLPAAGTFASYASGVNILNIGGAVVAGGLNNITLGTDEFLMGTGTVPSVGDQVTFAGSLNGNNGTRTISAVTLVSLNAANDRYVVQVATPFVATESPAAATLGGFAAPNGNLVRFSKSVADTASGAYSQVSLDTDVLLSRIVMPGQVIINYSTSNIDPSRFEFFMPHGSGVTIDWANTLAGNVTIAGSLQVVNLVTGTNYTITPASFPMVEGEALFIEVDELNLTPVPQVTLIENLPWGNKIQVLGGIKSSTFVPHLLVMGGLSSLASGEADVLGEELSDIQKARLGITSDTTYAAYSSTTVIGVPDSYAVALSKLDVQTGALANNQPKEEEFTGDGVATVFTVTTFTFSTDNTKYDNIVWMDGRKQAQDPAGGTAKAYRKVTVSSVQFTTAPDLGSRITIRKEGTAYGGVVAPTPGKLWSDAVDNDIVPPDLAFKLGGPTSRFAEGYIEELYVGKLIYKETLANISEIKTKASGSLSPIIAGKPIALYSDGKVYPADADATTGKIMVGIAIDTIGVGSSGRVILFGNNIPGVLTGLGLVSGSEVFVSNTGAYVDSLNVFAPADVIARVGWADCAEGISSGTATDLIMSYQKIASP